MSIIKYLNSKVSLLYTSKAEIQLSIIKAHTDHMCRKEKDRGRGWEGGRKEGRKVEGRKGGREEGRKGGRVIML